MKKPTFDNYGTPAILMFASFILLSFYTAKTKQESLELIIDTTRMGASHRIFVAKHDSLIKDIVYSENKHFTVLKAQAE